MADLPAGYTVLEGSERHPTTGAEVLGEANAGESFAVTIVLRRRPDGSPVPDFSYFAKTPPSQRPRLSREDFVAKYGAADDDIAKVVSFATSHGLEVASTDSARRTVVVSGTVSQMSEAFAVTLQSYQHEVTPRPGQDPVQETYRGRDGVIAVPSELEPIIVGVFGLDNRRITKRNLTGDPPNTTTLPTAKIASLYGFPTNSAAGQTIAILSEAGYLASDIDATFGGHPPTVTPISVDASNSGAADGETTQDICIAASAAPGASIAVYFTTFGQQGWVDLINRVIHPDAGDPTCHVLSSSFYIANGDDPATLTAEGITASMITAMSTAFQDAALQGVTVCIASGDTGAQSKLTDGKAHVQYPASDPWVLAVGGTTIGDVSGTSFEEYAWNDTWGGGNYASGGGVSYSFPLPDYQDGGMVPKSANGDGRVGRGVPDVAGNASPNAGYSGIVIGGSSSAGNGTSASAPLWAGLIAVINAALGEPVGYLNPQLYDLGSYVCRDISTPPGPANNSVNGVTGYPVKAGWDAVTGWGSPNGEALLDALRGVGEPPALAEFNGELYMAWKGIERDDRVFFSSFNGTSWSAQQLVPGIGSSTGVSLAAFDGKLYMAWKGILGDDGIYYSSFNGSAWAAQAQVAGVASSVGPQLAIFDGALYMIWKGMLTDQGIYYSHYNGSTWTPQADIAGVATAVGPDLAAFDGALYAAWKGMDDDEGIYYSHYNGSTWAAQVKVAGVASSQGPSLAVFDNALFAAWKGMQGDSGIYYSSFGGSTWTPQKEVSGIGTSQGPSLAVFNGKLYMVWKGIGSDEGIWFSSYDGSTWAAQQRGPGSTSPDL